MRETIDTTSREFFEAKYAADSDPWNFAGDAYELSRYATIIKALGGEHFDRAFEPGCSVGVLTEILAPSCGALLATDISEKALAQARARCAGLRQVRIEQGSVADADPGPLDLLVLSEIGYYSTAEALEQWAGRLIGSLQPGGTLLAAHWLGTSTDHMLPGDRVHGILHEQARQQHLALTLERRMDNFRLDVWKR